MASPRRIAYHVCTGLLILMFTLAGLMKLTPVLSAQVHGEQKTNFHAFVRIPPIDLLKLEPDVYRTIVAVVELVCVSCLICPHSKVQLLGNYVLMVIMLGALWTHYMVKDTADKFGPAVLCLTLLLTRLYTCGKLEVKLKAS